MQAPLPYFVANACSVHANACSVHANACSVHANACSVHANGTILPLTLAPLEAKILVFKLKYLQQGPSTSLTKSKFDKLKLILK